MNVDIIVIIGRLSCWQHGAVFADFSLLKKIYLFTDFLITSLKHVIMNWFDRHKKIKVQKVYSVAEHFVQFFLRPNFLDEACCAVYYSFFIMYSQF